LSAGLGLPAQFVATPIAFGALRAAVERRRRGRQQDWYSVACFRLNDGAESSLSGEVGPCPDTGQITGRCSKRGSRIIRHFPRALANELPVTMKKSEEFNHE